MTEIIDSSGHEGVPERYTLEPGVDAALDQLAAAIAAGVTVKISGFTFLKKTVDGTRTGYQTALRVLEPPILAPGRDAWSFSRFGLHECRERLDWTLQAIFERAGADAAQIGAPRDDLDLRHRFVLDISLARGVVAVPLAAYTTWVNPPLPLASLGAGQAPGQGPETL